MIVKSKDIIVYSLNPDIYKNRTYYIDVLKNMNIFKDVKRIVINHKMRDRVRTIIAAHINALMRAFDANDFPLLLLEDDARLIDKFPLEMNIPNEAELVYLGGSTYNCGQVPPVHIKEYNKDFYRVFNMVSAHAIMIPKKKDSRLIIDRYVNAIYSEVFNDVSLAMASKDHIYITPKNGLYFYQEGAVEKITKFLWKDKQKLLK
jgi:hypothetical protein